MNIETKFNLGDKVWVVTTNMIQKAIMCSLCKDSRKITLNGTEYKCPRCGDAHTGYLKYFHRHIVTFSGRIGKVSVEQYADKRIAGREYANKREEKYMLDATGIGSGNCWPVESLFATEKEAQQFCDQQNLVKIKEETEMGMHL